MDVGDPWGMDRGIQTPAGVRHETILRDHRARRLQRRATVRRRRSNIARRLIARTRSYVDRIVLRVAMTCSSRSGFVRCRSNPTARYVARSNVALSSVTARNSMSADSSWFSNSTNPMIATSCWSEIEAPVTSQFGTSWSVRGSRTRSIAEVVDFENVNALPWCP